MENERYWMWMSRKKSSMLSRVQSSTTSLTYSHKDSWEEQAFAEDAAGALGGCVWPPRSYTCSFCRREFRSAQALGGHMNVHRRDRARLKQSDSNSNLEQFPSSAELELQYPPQVSTLVCNPNPNPDPNPAAPSLSTSKTLTWPCEENGSDTSSPVQEHIKSFSFSILPSVTMKGLSVSDVKLDQEVSFRDQKQYVRTNSSVLSLGLVRQRSCTPEEDGDILEKRRRKAAPLPLFITSDIGERRMIDEPLPFFLRPVSHDRHHLRTEVLGLGANAIDDLDLELRLGDRPKVK